MSNPYPPFGSQDLHDDDGAVIDSFLIEVDNPPDLKDAQEVVDTPKTKIPPRLSRILTRDYLFTPANDPNNTPIQLLPSDPNRKGVGIRVWSPTLVVTDGIRLASDLGDLLSGGQVLHTQTPPGDSMNNHTGALYAVTTSALPVGGPASAPVRVWVWSVTE